MKKNWLVTLAIALGAVFLITLVASPSTSKLTSGSTYSIAPDGYGAWYAFASKQGITLKRWQKSFYRLPGVESNKKSPPITLLRVYSKLRRSWLYFEEEAWVKKGNTLAILGVESPPTKAKFRTWQSSSAGNVKISTTRRTSELKKNQKRLGDSFGAVVWEETIGKGRIIFGTTPHLAANAYQDAPGNYRFLTELLAKPGDTIWVDEYIHGYRDKETLVQEKRRNWIEYFAQTPLVSAFVQVMIILLVAIWAQSRRFGQAMTLKVPAVNNSEAYIKAIAGVLQKAKSHQFVWEMVGKAEQLQLQKALGLGTTLLDRETLINAWVEKTQQPRTELDELLQLPTQRRISDSVLLSWLGKWQAVLNRSQGLSSPYYLKNDRN